MLAAPGIYTKADPMNNIVFKFHHLGVACNDIEQTKRFVGSIMGVTSESEIVFDELQNASLCMLGTSDGLQIELIAGEQVKSLLKRGVSYYHTCYAVQDIEQAIRYLQTEENAVVISAAKPAILFKNKKVAFLKTPLGVVELLEEKQ